MRCVRGPYWAGIFCLWLYKCCVCQGFLWQLTLPGGSSVETWGLHKRRFLHYHTWSSIAGPWRRWLPGTWCVQPFPVWCRIWCNWIWLVFWLLWPWGVCTCLGGTPSDLSGSIPPVYWGPLGGARHLWVLPLLYKWWYHQQTIWCFSWCQYQCHWWTVKTEWGRGESLEVPQVVTGMLSEEEPSTTTRWERSLRKSPIQLMFLPRILYLLSFVRSLPCDTLSKALLKSITMQSTCLWVESIVWRSWSKSISWVSHDRPSLKPCCSGMWIPSLSDVCWSDSPWCAQTSSARRRSERLVGSWKLCVWTPS